jgi:hypothetical protein
MWRPVTAQNPEAALYLSAEIEKALQRKKWAN